MSLTSCPSVLLCAGASTRMGSPKGLLQLHGRPLLAHHCERLRAVGPVWVVLGAHAQRYEAVMPPDVHVVHNLEWARSWPSDSLRCALAELQDCERLLVTLVDTPPPLLGTLNALLEHPGPAVPTDPHGRDGHPVLLGPHELRRLRSAPVQGGLRALLHEAPRVPTSDPLVAIDFDDEEAWQQAQPLLNARASG